MSRIVLGIVWVPPEIGYGQFQIPSRLPSPPAVSNLRLCAKLPYCSDSAIYSQIPSVPISPLLN